LEAEYCAESSCQTLAAERRASLTKLSRCELKRVSVALLDQGQAEPIRLDRASWLTEKDLRARIDPLSDCFDQATSRFFVNALRVHPSSPTAGHGRFPRWPHSPPVEEILPAIV
jgi:hypothetical protein